MSCSLTNTLPKPKSVSVNGAVIAREVIALEVQNHPAEKPIDAWQAAARALVVRELLRQEASRLKIEAHPLRDAEGRTETPEEAAMRELVDREVVTPEPDEAACRRFYEQNLARFSSGNLYEVAHILLAAAPSHLQARTAARAIADKILEAVRATPESFADFAAEHSACTTSASEGGRLGQISRGQTVPEFDAAIARMSPGEFAIAESKYGFHVIRLDMRAEGRPIPFETARNRIVDYLIARVRQHAISQYLSILAGRADITGISLAGSTSPLVQ